MDAHDDTLAAILRDMLALPDGQSTGARSGPRSGPEFEEGLAQLRHLFGDRYQMERFPAAFRRLAGARSERHLAAKIGLSRATVHRLLTGEVAPKLDEMERIAKAFGKDPVWFHEYRTSLVCNLVRDRLDRSPEQSATAVHRLPRR